jgi:capsular polysaccharide transport system permease protein
MDYTPHRRVAARRFAMARSVFALMLRELASTHGRAAGGYAWRLAEPVLGLALFSYVASLAFRSPSLGNSFPIYFAGGWLPFLCFNDVQRRVAGAIMYSRQLLTYPSVTVIDAIVARAVLAYMTQIVIFYLIVASLEMALTTDTSYRYERIVGGMCMAAALGLGIGTFNCFFWHYFPVWRRVWKILTRPLMLLSGVLFIYEDVPSSYQHVIWWNPLVHVTGYVRSGFFSNYNPDWVSFTYVYLCALVPGVVGLFFLHHFHRRILNMA